MSSNNSGLKPMKLYSHASGPNPWKVVMTLKALGISYYTEYVNFDVIKQEPYISVNPNGRVPSLEDPNTGLTLWESGAIMQYLAHKYDPSHSISYEVGSDAYFKTIQWLSFQISGQGPYFGQAAWFSFFHPEKLPSAIARYQKEIARVTSVIDLHLTKTKQKYLVADKENPEGKLTIADIAFVPWAVGADRLSNKDEPLYGDGKNQAYKEWLERVTANSSVAEALEEKNKASTH